MPFWLLKNYHDCIWPDDPISDSYESNTVTYRVLNIKVIALVNTFLEIALFLFFGVATDLLVQINTMYAQFTMHF